MIVAISAFSSGSVVIPQKQAGTAQTNHGTCCGTLQQDPQESFWQNPTSDPIALFTGILTVATVGLWLSTSALWWTTRRIAVDTKKSGETQAAKMERSAAAMEGVKDSMAINAAKIVESVDHQKTFGKMQMRAYVSVLLDERPVYQDANLRFQAHPSLRNTGHTPAQKLRWRINGAIERLPVTLDFNFPLPAPKEGENILMPQATATLEYLLPGRLVDELVPDVMSGNGWGFYVWGIVSYEDVFGDPHETKFAHIYNFFPTNEIREDGLRPVRYNGVYFPRHNEAE